MQIHDNQGNIIDDLNPLPTKEVDSTIVKPVKIDSHTALTTQTHNAVSVPLSGTSDAASWLDCDGFDKIALTLKNDASTSSTLAVLWSNDGTTSHGYEAFVANTNTLVSAITDIKARYAKVRVINGDGAAAHTISAWAYLKA